MLCDGPFSSHAGGGMGFGVIAGVVAFSNVLKESGGLGIVGVNGTILCAYLKYDTFVRCLHAYIPYSRLFWRAFKLANWSKNVIGEF